MSSGTFLRIFNLATSSPAVQNSCLELSRHVDSTKTDQFFEMLPSLPIYEIINLYCVWVVVDYSDYEKSIYICHEPCCNFRTLRGNLRKMILSLI